MSDTSITRRDHVLDWKRETTQNHVFQLQPFKGYILEVEDVHFHHDSAVFLPDYGDAPDPARIDGLSVLAAAYRHAADNPSHQLLDAGHTDTSGQDAYNLTLSGQRADSVLHALLGNRSSWVSVTLAKHKVEDYQQIVKWTSWAYGWDSDPGAIDNVHGSKTTEGVKGFQRNYNETFGGSLAVDGVVGEKTWGAIFDVYMDYLKKTLEVDDAGLAAARAKLNFLGPKRVGCGENFPIEAPRQNNYRSKINRRVELLFFEPDQVPKLDCHPGSNCNAILCEVYNPKMYKYTHITPVPKPPKDPKYDLTNVKSPDHIAPEKEKIKIEYDIVNVDAVITSGKLEIFRKKDNKLLKKFGLTPAQYTEGHHDDFEWDGAVTKDGDFPDGFATIEHSDYIAKVTVSGPKGDRTGSTEIKVELKEFKVELAPKAVLTKDADKAVYDPIGTIPAGSLVKVKLKSNIFTITVGDEMGDQTAYTEYQKLWSGGPRVPLYATATVIDSKGNGVVCGKAMGRAKVLWDFTDPKQSLDTYLAVPLTAPPAVNQSQGAKPYIDKALNYDKAATRPKNGDNCDIDRGGKRLSASGPPIFHGSDGGTQNFPFTVNKGSTRFWGCFANFEKSGADEGRAGAIFRPARQAGDNYSITAYLDLTASLDTADDTPTGALKQVKVGDFEIWRLVNLAEHFKKGPQTTGAMPSFAEYYADAFIEVKDDRGGVKDLTKAQYDPAFTAAFALAGGNALIRKYGLVPGSQWDAPVPATPPPAPSPSVWIATFRPYTDFKTAVSAGEGKAGAALQALLNSNNVGTASNYHSRVQTLAKSIGDEMCRAISTKDGLTILQFGGTSNLEGATGSSGINGRAVSQKTAANRSRAGFLLCQTDAQAAQTPAHEIGHLMFLPHAPSLKSDGTPRTDDIGQVPDFHDGKNMNCVMSYTRPRPGFCGLCLLRLRGWKGDQFDKNGPKVTK